MTTMQSLNCCHVVRMEYHPHLTTYGTGGPCDTTMADGRFPKLRGIAQHNTLGPFPRLQSVCSSLPHPAKLPWLEEKQPMLQKSIF
ncbi:uncharacterized protein LOC135062237 isoform X1 [Pseudophryne corroboree]|uniref:uncharacterized protein LOC135062237 isoform X1 n=1 Tax=Pseudophryne corroboree TaxID=495146 RepID=UPI00308173ED